MLSDIKYFRIREILSTVISYLATGKGDMRERLGVIFIEIDELNEDDFPVELQKDWNFVVSTLTKYPPTYKYDGCLDLSSSEHTLSKIKNQTACKVAEKIYYLYEEMIFGKYSHFSCV
jgi:hypothetical protein